MKNSEPKWRRFEKLVARVQEDLAPNAVVTHNNKIKGCDSSELRQIDVTVKQKVGQYDMLIAIDCKDYKRAVNVKDVEQFIGLIKDIRANKGVMVAANGFSSTAKRIGEKAGLDLYRLFDAEAYDWKAYATIPVLCDFRGLQQFQFSIPNSVSMFVPSMDPNEIAVYDHNSPQAVTLTDVLRDQWNLGKLPYEPGEHRNIPLIRVTTGFTRGKVFEAEILTHIRVKRRLFFGQLPLIQGKGFLDEYAGHLLIPGGFTTDWLNAADVERNWRKLESVDEIAVKPVLKLLALDAFSLFKEP